MTNVQSDHSVTGRTLQFFNTHFHYSLYLAMTHSHLCSKMHYLSASGALASIIHIRIEIHTHTHTLLHTRAHPSTNTAYYSICLIRPWWTGCCTRRLSCWIICHTHTHTHIHTHTHAYTHTHHKQKNCIFTLSVCPWWAGSAGRTRSQGCRITWHTKPLSPFKCS